MVVAELDEEGELVSASGVELVGGAAVVRILRMRHGGGIGCGGARNARCVPVALFGGLQNDLLVERFELG